MRVYASIVRILSASLLSILLGVISGIVINFITSPDQLQQNKTAVILYALTLIPFLIMIQIREKIESAFQIKVGKEGRNKDSWQLTVSFGNNPRTIGFIVSFVLIVGLIWAGTRNLNNAANAIDAKPEDLKKSETAVKQLSADTAVLNQKIRELEMRIKKDTSSLHP